MQANFKKPLFFPALNVIILALSMPKAYADVSYVSSAALSYDIVNTGSTNPYDLSGLAISGIFQQLTDTNDAYAFTSGDGTYSAANPDVSLDPLPAHNFASSMTVSGDTPVFGTVETLHMGDFSLNVSNNSATTINLEVTLNYLLSAAANGAYANSAIELDYWDAGNIISGSDALDAGNYPVVVNDLQSKNGIAVLDLSLAPGATDSFMTQVAFTSYLDSTSNSPAAVLVPGAAWLFVSGLFWLGGQKYRGNRVAPY